MNPQELQILNEIESAMYESDAAFASRIASGPQLSSVHKTGLAAATIGGIALVMLFSANLVFGLAGYLVLVAVGTTALRHRPLQPAQNSPLELLHRVTGDLFRNPDPEMESNLDEFRD